MIDYLTSIYHYGLHKINESLGILCTPYAVSPQVYMRYQLILNGWRMVERDSKSFPERKKIEPNDIQKGYVKNKGYSHDNFQNQRKTAAALFIFHCGFWRNLMEDSCIFAHLLLSYVGKRRTYTFWRETASSHPVHGIQETRSKDQKKMRTNMRISSISLIPTLSKRGSLCCKITDFLSHHKSRRAGKKC